MTEPTDAEILALALELGIRMRTGGGVIKLVNAALAKWGNQAQAAEPVAWLHDCAALLTNDVELWIDACPHCGKPRNAPQPVAREPLEPCMDNVEGINARLHFRRGWKAAEQAHGIKGGQHGTE